MSNVVPVVRGKFFQRKKVFFSVQGLIVGKTDPSSFIPVINVCWYLGVNITKLFFTLPLQNKLECSSHATALPPVRLGSRVRTFKARVHWQSFFDKNVSDSVRLIETVDRLCTCIGLLRGHDTDRVISICVEPPKVAKASMVVTVACRCCWCYRTKRCQLKYSFRKVLSKLLLNMELG
jgi:hypothetical protein